MAPTLVNAALGALVALALLGAAFDRRSLLVVAIAAVLPDLDALASLVVHGATNALLHTLLVPAVAVAALYWDTRIRESSRVAERYGRHGVRVAWVAVAAYAVAGIGPDLFGSEGANLLYPLHDRFYAVSGRFLLSSREIAIQTFVEPGDGLLWLSSPGTTADYHVASWANPTPGTGLETGVERRFRIVESGWQLVVLAASAVAVGARFRLEGGD